MRARFIPMSKWEMRVNTLSNIHSSPPYWDSALLHQAQACPWSALSHHCLKTLNSFISNCSWRGLRLSRIQKVCTLILPRGYDYILPRDIPSILSFFFFFLCGARFALLSKSYLRTNVKTAHTVFGVIFTYTLKHNYIYSLG